MEWFAVMINGQPQRLADHGRFLASCTDIENSTLFTQRIFAEQAAQKTLRYAEDKGYSNWGIVQSGYQIYSVSLKLVSDEAKPADPAYFKSEEGRNHLKALMRGTD